MEEENINFILHVIGFTIIYSAVNYKREVNIKLFSKDWWPIIAMISIGGALIGINL